MKPALVAVVFCFFAVLVAIRALGYPWERAAICLLVGCALYLFTSAKVTQ